MKFTKVADDAGLISARCDGEISALHLAANADPMRDVLGPTAFASKLLVDLSGAAFIDSSGISWLILTHKEFAQHGGMMVLHSIPPLVLQVMKLMKMDLVLNLAADAAAARRLVQGAKP